MSHSALKSRKVLGFPPDLGAGTVIAPASTARRAQVGCDAEEKWKIQDPKTQMESSS